MANKTALAVGLFIILLLAAGYARSEVRIGLGHSFASSELVVGEIAYEYSDWEISATKMEAGKTRNGYQDTMEIYSVSYLTRPFNYAPANPFLRLGVSQNTGSPLVGRTNFRLGLGVDFSDVWRLEYAHHSSAGIHNPNTGIDYVVMSYTMPAPWE